MSLFSPILVLQLYSDGRVLVWHAAMCCSIFIVALGAFWKTVCQAVPLAAGGTELGAAMRGSLWSGWGTPLQGLVLPCSECLRSSVFAVTLGTYAALIWKDWSCLTVLAKLIPCLYPAVSLGSSPWWRRLGKLQTCFGSDYALCSLLVITVGIREKYL